MNINESEILFKKFKIINCFKKNDHSAVYLANHIFLEKKVFLKILHIVSIPDESITDRFKREAKILAKLNHPNIIDVYDFGIYKEFFYISFEYFESKNLREILSVENLSDELKQKILNQIVKGLCYAHENHVIHRDIKPENILVNENYDVKLTDFGLAQESLDSNITQQFSVIGTPAYMSPEQINGEGVTEKSDLFSLGVTIFELFSGKNPFLGNDTNETINNIVSFDNLSESEEINNFSNEIQEILRGLLVKEPKDRFTSCKDILAILNLEFESAIQEPNKKSIRTRILILLLLLPLAIYGIYLIFPKSESQPKKNTIIDTVQKNLVQSEIVEENNQQMESEKIDNLLSSKEITDDNKTTKLEIIPAEGEKPIEKVVPTRGELYVKCYPWAKVYLNEEFIETTPLSRNINKPTGNYLLTLSHPNYPKFEDSIKILGNELTFVEVNLDTLFGFFNCKVYPWGEIFVNDVSKGITPIQESIKLLPGEYQLKISNPNLSTYESIINITRNDTLFIKINLESRNTL